LRGEAARHCRIHTKARIRVICVCAEPANGPKFK